MLNRALCYFLILFLLSLAIPLKAEWGLGGCRTELMEDLMIVDSVNRYLEEGFPVYYNNILYGGYFNMPSALMGKEGEIGFGVSSVHPYRNYNLRIQLLDRIELSGNYRLFRGIDDPILSPTGFGDKSDKGANVKIALMHPSDCNYILPGIAIGFEDFTGTKGFESNYLVFTQVFPKWNVECSLGYGKKRIRKWFGGATWIPFRNSCNGYIKDFAFAIEYDAVPYKSEKREPHPDGRSQKSKINFGLKWRLYDWLDLSTSWVRGEKFSYSASAFYNFGMTNGFFPKINNPLPYTSPRVTEPLGPLRPNDVLVQDLVYPFEAQGFELQEAWLSCNPTGRKVLRLKIFNFTWRYEDEVRSRLNDLLAGLIPSDISEVIVVMMSDNWPIQEYRFPMEFVRLYGEQKVCPYELFVLTPMKEAEEPCKGAFCRIFKSEYNWFNTALFPKTFSAFGSSRGKYKSLFGIHFGIDGFIFNGWFYNILLGYTLYSNLEDVSTVDRLNPSQIINVRTDTVDYFKKERFTVDQAYIQKWWNMGHGWYGTFALGLFEEAYGGLAGEFLYYPVNSNWAFGIEGAYLRKRQYYGVGFTDLVRKLEGFRPTYKKYHGSQYFADLYYDFNCLDMELHFKAGKFLAHDWGVRSEFSRYYPSGMRLFLWYTYTNARDYVNGQRYQDRGVGISLPLDMFFTYSSQKRWGYAMSAWLRDVGAISGTGIPLYYQIRDQREREVRPSRCSWW